MPSTPKDSAEIAELTRPIVAAQSTMRAVVYDGPERKRLEEVVKNHVEPRVPLPEVDRVREQMEHLQKDRQVLFAQGNAVYQECRGIMAEIQRALSTLQRNAADNAKRKRDAKRQKGKHF